MGIGSSPSGPSVTIQCLTWLGIVIDFDLMYQIDGTYLIDGCQLEVVTVKIRM